MGCTICYEPFGQDDSICLIKKCEHSFHRDCVIEWLEKSKTCPTCRETTSREDLQNIRFSLVTEDFGISDLKKRLEEMELKYAMNQTMLEERTKILEAVANENE